jgi:hypothetical protein
MIVYRERASSHAAVGGREPGTESKEAATSMLRPLSTFAVAASLLAAALALSMPAQARDSETVPATASSSEFSARAQSAAPVVKRTRKASTYQRRVASMAQPVSYHPQCFLFWCTAGGRSYNLLMLGVAY